MIYYCDGGVIGSPPSIADESPCNSVEINKGIGTPISATYVKLLQKNRPFRLYLASYIVTLMGDWLTYIASISLIEEILKQSGRSSRTAVSVLVVVRLVPLILLSPFSGALADARDRRESMIILDLFGTVIPFLFLFAMAQRSILMVYFVTFLKDSLAGLYEPSRSAIIPLLVPEEVYLQKATTLSEMTWSVMAAVGSVTGGLILGFFNFQTCFMLNSLTYLFSAYLLWLIGGTWRASSEQTDQESPWERLKGMTIEGLAYLKSTPCGAFVLFKASGAVVYGSADVLNVSFSEQNYGGRGGDSALRLGILFACSGIGCVMGPLIADQVTRMDVPVSLQKACICGLGIAAFGCYGLSLELSFWSVCIFTIIRSSGDSTNWIDSSLLLQKFASKEMLGRATAVEYALAYLTEAITAYFCGALADYFGLSANEISIVFGVMGTVVFCLWLCFHFAEGGANKPDASEQWQSGCQHVTENSLLIPARGAEKPSMLCKDPR